ncbi:MAG TPA: hypothetical protein VGT98_10825, partial [Candidatus Elarobacter sp.]|nr:hypothetical protein [Candidatus Elarobacter sp.]
VKSAADIYAAGAVVWFALTGSPPYRAADARSLVAMQLRHRLPDAPLPGPVAHWCHTALAPDPRRRFVDADAMRSAWRAALDAARVHITGQHSVVGTSSSRSSDARRIRAGLRRILRAASPSADR